MSVNFDLLTAQFHRVHFSPHLQLSRNLAKFTQAVITYRINKLLVFDRGHTCTLSITDSLTTECLRRLTASKGRERITYESLDISGWLAVMAFVMCVGVSSRKLASIASSGSKSSTLFTGMEELRTCVEATNRCQPLCVIYSQD